MYTFATAKAKRCVSSAWLECLPVTQEVTGSSPVRTAKAFQLEGFLLFVRTTLTHVTFTVRVLSVATLESALF